MNIREMEDEGAMSMELAHDPFESLVFERSVFKCWVLLLELFLNKDS